eukprot:s1173_g18.t1
MFNAYLLGSSLPSIAPTLPEFLYSSWVLAPTPDLKPVPLSPTHRSPSDQNKLSEKDLRIAAAHECVGLVVKKWILGDAEGMKVQVYQVWSQLALKKAEDEKKLESVRMALSKWARGDAKGVVQMVFSSWKHDASVAAGERKTEAALDVEREKMEKYLEARHSSAFFGLRLFWCCQDLPA